MSNNQEYQDKIEQGCLEFVKRNLKEKDLFGLSNEQYIELEHWLNNSELNLNNRFPDFTFSNGFIEHFAVTSSLEDKKGSKQKRESSIFFKKSESNFLSKLDNSEEEKVIIGQSYGRKFEEHAYGHIVNSIKKNWIKHIESYDKNITTSKNGIFLIEYIDINIQTAVSTKNESVKIFDTYRISVDKHMLEWIHNYKEKIDYLILVNILSSSIEVIRIDCIPKIIEGIPDVWYAPIVGMESHKYVGIKTNNTDT
ncbi:hypothetical protein AB5N96_12280 [Chryseomicrobium imtechense]